jgi:hypothetical protein
MKNIVVVTLVLAGTFGLYRFAQGCRRDPLTAYKLFS